MEDIRDTKFIVAYNLDFDYNVVGAELKRLLDSEKI
jgi:DNA polymerase III epsilon subunit-like protein